MRTQLLRWLVPALIFPIYLQPLNPTRSSYQRGGIVTQHKASKTLAFKTLAQVRMGGGWVVRRGAAGFALAVTSLFKEARTEDSFAGHA